MSSLTIEVTHKFDPKAEQLITDLIGALGAARTAVPVTTTAPGPSAEASARAEDEREDGGEAAASPSTPPARERGKPAPGKKRRTKAEIAEDDAADAADKQAADAADAARDAQAQADAADAGEPDAGGEAEVDFGALADELRQRFREHAKEFGREKTLALFEGLSGQGVSTVKQEELLILKQRLDAGANDEGTAQQGGLFD